MKITLEKTDMTINQKNTIAFLPLGAYEQHGEHLPFETDTLIATAFSKYIKKQLPDYIDMHFLSTEPIGYSIEHTFSSESKSLDYNTAIDLWLAKALECKKNNINKIIFFNAHGGNSPILSIVATELRIKHNMLAVVTSWNRFLKDCPFLNDMQKSFDIHAGELETALMLAIAPNMVDMSKAKDFYNQQQDFCKNFNYLKAYGPHYFGWSMSDLNKYGACGNASIAKAELGYKIIDYVIKEFLKLLDDVYKFDIKYHFNK
ncbi:creatininase family protein [Bartonella sp. DGB1]|uniref:creatininase family protein n=1 Tax=Bartonella sp. DGB1 TaxID=3239807 RepID=UPI003525E6A0